MDDKTLTKLKALKWSKEASKFMKWIRYYAHDGEFTYEFTKRTLYIFDINDSDGDNPHYKASGEKLQRRLALTIDQTCELEDAIIESVHRKEASSSSNSGSDSDSD